MAYGHIRKQKENGGLDKESVPIGMHRIEKDLNTF
jgi:hypothetical protein